MFVEVQGQLVALSLPTGDEQWRTPVSPLRSALWTEGDRLISTTSGGLEIRDSATGSKVATADKPSGWMGERLPDQVRVADGQITVASEYGVAAYGLGDAALRWHHAVASKGKLRFDQARAAHEDAVRTLAYEAGAPTPDAGGLQLAFVEFSSPSTTQQRRAAEAWSTRRAVYSDATSTRAEKQWANDEWAIASSAAAAEQDINAAFAKMERTTSMQMAAMSFTLGLSDQIEAIEASKTARYYETRLHTTRARLDIARRAQSRSLQHDRWYLRPFSWVDGQGILVVDTRDGRWREIITSADEGDMEEWFIKLPLSTVSADGTKVLTHGIGLQPDEWQSDRSIPQYQTAYRSVQAYDLRDLKLREPGEFATRSVVALAREG